MVKRLFQVLYIFFIFLFICFFLGSIFSYIANSSQNIEILGLPFILLIPCVCLIAIQYIVYGYLNPLKLFKKDKF